MGVAKHVVRAYGSDVITGEAPGISLQDMIEVAVNNLVKEMDDKMRLMEKAEKVCPICGKQYAHAAFIKNEGAPTAVAVCSPRCVKRRK